MMSLNFQKKSDNIQLLPEKELKDIKLLSCPLVKTNGKTT